MNSLGAGGEEKPYLVNGANALTFCLMVVSCFFSPILVRRVGIKWALIFGTMGYVSTRIFGALFPTLGISRIINAPDMHAFLEVKSPTRTLDFTSLGNTDSGNLTGPFRRWTLYQ